MNEPSWGELGGKIEPEWGPQRERAVRAAISRRAVRGRVVRYSAVAVLSTGVLAAGAFAFISRRLPAPPLATPVTVSAPVPNAPLSSPKETVTVTQLSSNTVIEPLANRAGRGFALRAGAARFSVMHDAQRPFVVTAGDVTIEDLGTTFTVRYLADDRLHIAVEEGRVRVRAAEAVSEVVAGGTLDVRLPSVAPLRRHLRASADATPAWRSLAESGQFEKADKALRRAGVAAVRDDTGDLLLAADTARLSGHPSDSVPYLERIIHGHVPDPRTPLAAFTLGRVLLDELGRPGEAIEAFARARAAGGPLAEDALAREVEAASRSGEARRSHDLALTYRQLYPKGRRANAVARFGGTD